MNARRLVKLGELKEAVTNGHKNRAIGIINRLIDDETTESDSETPKEETQ